MEILNEVVFTSKNAVEELIKTKRSSGGSSVESKKKKKGAMMKQLLTLLSSLLNILSMLYTLIENYNTNKNSLKKDAEKNSRDSLKSLAGSMGMKEHKKEDSATHLAEPNIPKRDIPNNLESVTQSQNSDFMNSMDVEEEKTPYYPSIIPEGLFSSTSDVAYSNSGSEESNVIDSELLRIDAEIDRCAPICILDQNKTVVSTSTKTNGGKVENLEFCGKTRKELADAILNINNGKNL